MGINLSFLPFFDAAKEQGCFDSGSILVLGSQTLHDSKESIRKYAVLEGHRELADTLDIRILFKERYKINSYQDCDINDSADLKLDLSKSLPSTMLSQFSCVLEAGTFEHIFDIGMAFRNLHDMLSPGGVMLHISPVSWLNHAFYNLNPLLFEQIARANKYEKLVEAYHFPGKRRFWKKDRLPDMLVTFNGGLHKDKNAEAQRVLHGDSRLTPHCLYMCAFRKKENSEFKIPYDITD